MPAQCVSTLVMIIRPAIRFKIFAWQSALHKKSFCGRRLRRRFSATSHFGKCGSPPSRSETAPTDFLAKTTAISATRQIA
jgi:hypothetical protein